MSADITSVLPAWVPWAGPLLALVTLMAVSLVVTRVVVAGSLRAAQRTEEWTERARHVHVARAGVAIALLVLPVVAVAAASAFIGPLAAIPRSIVIVVLVALGAGVGVFQSAAVDRFVHGPSDEGLLHAAFGAVMSYSLLLVLAALGWFAPSNLGTWTIAPWLVVVLGVVYAWLRVPLVLSKTPLARDADDRTKAVVERAAESLSVHVDRVIEFRTRQPNAFAFPWIKVLAFTSGMLRVLDDEELEAITHHELAHLAESAGLTRLRQAQLYAIVPVIATRPLLGTFGLLGPLAAMLAFIATTEIVRRRGVVAERASDAAALDSIHGSDVYGRALERTYRLGLIPAVVRRATHGQLHERLEAAGVEPDFEPPAPPSRGRGLAASAATVVVLFVAWLSPWLAHLVAADESLFPTQFSAALPIYGTDSLEWLASEAEFDERWRDAALLYDAAADVRPDKEYLRLEAMRAWVYAGDCARAGRSARMLVAETSIDDFDAEELIDWCELTGGLPAG